MRSHELVVAVVIALLAACDGPEDCTVSSPGCGNSAVAITITPQTLTLGVGDTASVAVAARQGGRAAAPDVRWAAGSPTVIALDSAPAAAARVRLRATAVGASVLTAVVRVGGQQSTSVINVMVTAR